MPLLSVLLALAVAAASGAAGDVDAVPGVAPASISSEAPSGRELPAVLQQIRSGTRIQVTATDGRTIDGILRGVSDTELVLDVAGQLRRMRFDAVGRIERRGGFGSRTWMTAWGLAAYASLGPLMSCSPDCAKTAATSAAAGGAIGFTIGALFDRHSHHRTLYGPAVASPNALVPASSVARLADIWRRVRSGDEIEVTTSNGNRQRLAFVASTADALTVQAGTTEVIIPAGDVRQVKRMGDRRWAFGLVGLGLAIVPAGNATNWPVYAAVMGPLQMFPIMGLGSAFDRGAPVYSVKPPYRTMGVRIAPMVAPRVAGVSLTISHW